MKNIQEEVDKINELVNTDITKAYAPFIELYNYCKESNQLEDLATFQILLINSDRIDEKSVQLKALLLLAKLYEEKNIYDHFKIKLFIGRLYMRLNQFHKALKLLRNALDYFRSINDVIRIVNCYSCMGLLHLRIEYYDESLKFFHEGLFTLQSHKEKLVENKYQFQYGIFTYNIALINLLAENYKESEKFLLKNIGVTKLNTSSYNYFNSKNLLIHLKIKLNQPEGIDDIINELLAIDGIKTSRLYPLLLSTIAEYKEYNGALEAADMDIKKSLKYLLKFNNISAQNYDRVVDKGLALAFKRNHLEDIAWYTKEMQKIKAKNQKEFLHYSEISLKQIDEISELEYEKKQLEEISYILGHDLKTPIRIAKNMAEIVQQDPTSCKEIIPKIISNSKHALELIDATLNFSKLSLNSNSFKKISLTKVLNNVIHHLKDLIEKHHAEINSNELPTVYGNYTLLNQLFTNLISNAIIYNNGKPIIDISYTLKNNVFIIEIKDNGIGIPEKELEKVFKLFNKLSIKTDEQGAGVGLSICKKIVEKHKGSIYAKSKVAEGTSFFIELPLQ